MLAGMYERIAYLTEDCNVDDRGPVATGLFSCFLDWAADEPPPGEVASDVADSLPLAEALKWARARTDRVAVRIACEGGYSAGRVRCQSRRSTSRGNSVRGARRGGSFLTAPRSIHRSRGT